MALRMTEEEYAAFRARMGQGAREETPETPKRRKYGNVPTEVDGIRFDSKHEARVYEELKLRAAAGEIRCILRQVKFDLPGGIRYIADFVLIGNDFTIEGVYDAKSEATKKNRVYVNKKKQMKAIYGIDIKEV